MKTHAKLIIAFLPCYASGQRRCTGRFPSLSISRPYTGLISHRPVQDSTCPQGSAQPCVDPSQVLICNDCKHRAEPTHQRYLVFTPLFPSVHAVLLCQSLNKIMLVLAAQIILLSGCARDR
eukprot:1138449-Pelagomonas_calceolata.AAC.2